MKRGIFVLLIAFFPLSGCLDRGIPFDGERAFAHLERQVAFGPRVPGSEAHVKAQEYIAGELERHCDEVRLQLFSVDYEGKTFPMANIVCRINPHVSPKILLAAHYDSRPYADQDIPENHGKPVPGANDGASGVAVLLEVARVLSQKKPDFGVVIVLFDGEDFGKTLDYYFLGSRHFAGRMDFTPDKAILLDMIGDKDLNIYIEGNSRACCTPLVDEIWGIAKDNDVFGFIPEEKYSIMDDHIPFIDRGINMIDIIDFDYPYWHTLEDTPDKCSEESLEAVGEVLLIFIYSQP